jgi:hypothetical protein
VAQGVGPEFKPQYCKKGRGGVYDIQHNEKYQRRVRVIIMVYKTFQVSMARKI